MKVLLLSLLFSFSTFSQGIYSDFGIARIYCFAENGDVEVELMQRDNIFHSLKTLGKDIYNINILAKVDVIPNGVTLYLENVERSPVSFIVDNEDNVVIEGLSVLMDTGANFNFYCEVE